MVEIKLMLAIICTFLLGILIAPLILRVMRALKAGQPILEYVDKHEGKSGTPTMGGLIFLIPVSIMVLIFCHDVERSGIVAMATALSYGLVGFLDDFLKVKQKHNKGLKVYQKVIGQLGIAVIVTIYCYKNNYIGSSINVPFINKAIDLDWWYIPFCLFVYIAMTNAVNLTDGLDGLVAKTSSVNFLFLAILTYIAYFTAKQMGQTFYAKHLESLMYFAGAMLGGVLAFLWFNNYPAKIFMGDTGSLAMGGALASVALFSSQPLIILLIGIMYIVSCISVIVQVIGFKLTKKRIFLIAPFHHHLEYKGLHENRITGMYATISFLMGAVAVISILI